MKKIILTLLVLATISACTRTHNKLEETNPLVIPPSYGQRPAIN